jgi:glycosyltransferase involved in cell wall biosynthesis
MIKSTSYQPDRRPRIGIDMHVVDGIFQGSRTHCLELFSRVIALTPECDFVVLAGDPEKLVSFSESFLLPHVTLCTMRERPASVRLLLQLPHLVRGLGISLLHTQYITPPVSFCATAVTVHDILFESHPELFERFFVSRSRLLVPLSIRRSAAVFTVSEYSRKQICGTYAVPAAKVHTIPNGVDRSRFVPGEVGLEFLTEYDLKPKSYFLTVGRLEPRKNHATLLRAWAQMNAPRPHLVVVGQRDFQYREVFELIETLGLQQDVKVLEDVSDAQLPAIYRHAKGFVYCSRAEGFGMPLLEAMASGIPVVSSANTALSEVCGDAALLVDPDSPTKIHDAVLALDQKPELREELIRRGQLQAVEFTWEKSAQTVREIYLRHFGLCAGADEAEIRRPGHP